jgi:hypothetical protein
LQTIDFFDQVFQRPPKPIQLPNHQRIPRSNELEGLLETIAFSLCATGNIRKEFLATRFFERIALKLEVLILSADSGVTNKYGFMVLQVCFKK